MTEPKHTRKPKKAEKSKAKGHRYDPERSKVVKRMKKKIQKRHPPPTRTH